MTAPSATVPLGSSCDVALQNTATYRLEAAELRAWLAGLLRELAPEATSLGVRFCGRRAMRTLNRDFRGRDRATDVLSFPGDEPGPDGIRHLGDIVLCVPRAAAQAVERGHSLRREIRLLLLHGVLHCLGHDHESDDGRMERLERRLRGRWLDR